MTLGINENKRTTTILGTFVAFTFSYILISLTQNSLPFWDNVLFVTVALTTSFSLVLPLDRKYLDGKYSAVEDKEDEYELY